MSKRNKRWLIIATSLTVIGLVIFVIAMSINGWDFSQLSTEKYETNTYEISEEFRDISLKTNTADVYFAVSADGKCNVECYEQTKVKHSVNVQNETLVINVVDDREWYEHIGINIGSPKITIYLPEDDYVSVMKIKTATGDICIDGMSVEMIDFTVSTGDIAISNVECENSVRLEVSTGKTKVTDTTCRKLISDGSTGDISLEYVIVEDKIYIERDTGDVKFSKCDAGEISVETDTGDITGSLLTDKVFITESDTGKISVPKTANGGRCELSTDTGDIKISISNK